MFKYLILNNIFKKAIWRQQSAGRAAPLWAALLLSVLAHAVTLSGSWLRLPREANEPPPLTARLLLAPETKPAAVAKPATQPRARTASTPVAPARPKLDSLDLPAPWMPPEPDTLAQAAAPLEPTAMEPEPDTHANATPSTFAPEPALIKTLPRRGRITYDLNYYLSATPTLVGRTVQTWEAGDDTYQLDSQSETVGLARLTRFGPRSFHSSGTVTEHGLQPRQFTAKAVMRGKADDTSAALFDWSNNTLQFGRPADQKSTALPAGSQDLLSFMYQLSLAPPPRGRLQLPITNGTRFENYAIDVLAEEILETPLGRLRTLPVKQARREGRESVEVWLAAEYYYLPVRIRVINRDGSIGGEQIATAIHIGEN